MMNLFAKFSKPIASEESVTVKDVDGDVPKFARIYTCKVPRGLTMKVTIRSYSFGTSRSGELDQPNGSWVTFNPEKPAEKILDREIVPEVQRLCAEIIRADDAFRKSKPEKWRDESGTIWTKTV